MRRRRNPMKYKNSLISILMLIVRILNKCTTNPKQKTNPASGLNYGDIASRRRSSHRCGSGSCGKCFGCQSNSRLSLR
ncbi:uncharacterized protein BJ212DRAFT_1353309 [Suillus subaureus]|uniref:Secreted protein n=1 Tax=Suillus subaureus TaxID=48587 RepID=A0A9P7JE10_9AGAM|nr:uncharacterized protein BJ212DRAFT_1353309 [Suillus subaureus]KAG1816799.1 hypothetical protein BJ212DRAFT_1353309 [Suillus subaureus]